MRSGHNRFAARTPKREQNWFLRGWAYRDSTDGKKRRLVYTGEYYRLSVNGAARVRSKRLAAALYVLLAADYLAFETTLSQGGLVWYAGAPCLLAVIPLFYLGLGVWNFCRSEPYFTYRRMFAAYTRLRIGGRGVLALLGVGTAGQLVFVLRYGRLLALGPELVTLFGAFIGALLSGGLLLLLRRTPCEEVSPGEYPGEKG